MISAHQPGRPVSNQPGGVGRTLPGGLRCLKVRDPGHELISGGSDGSVKRWARFHPPRSTHCLSLRDPRPHACASSPPHRMIACAANIPLPQFVEDLLRCGHYPAESGNPKPIEERKLDDSTQFRSIDCQPGGNVRPSRRFFTATHKTPCSWLNDTPQPSRHTTAGSDKRSLLSSSRISSQGILLGEYGCDIWEVQDEFKCLVSGHSEDVNGLAFHPTVHRWCARRCSALICVFWPPRTGHGTYSAPLECDAQVCDLQRQQQGVRLGHGHALHARKLPRRGSAPPTRISLFVSLSSAHFLTLRSAG